MAVAVKEYLNSMKTVSSSPSAQKSDTDQNSLKLQLLLSQLIEAISYANSIDFRQKTLNAPARGTNPDNQTGREVLEAMKKQEVLIAQLAKGQELSKEQSKELTGAINKFYELAGASEIDYKKFAASLEKFALQDLPEAVQTRLINDSRDAHMIGTEQKRGESPVLRILKKIRNMMEDSAENTKQFTKRLFVTLDQFKDGLLSAFDALADKVDSNSFLDNIADLINMLGMLHMGLSGMFQEGNFKWGQLIKQIDNIKTMFKAFKGIAKAGTKIKGPIKAIKDMIIGAKLIGRALTKGFAKAGFNPKGPMKAIKGMLSGVKSIGKSIGQIPKVLKPGVNFKSAVSAAKGMISGLKNVGKTIGQIPKVLGGFAKGMKFAAGGVGKGIAKGLGKGVLKKVPLLGTLLSLWMAFERWKKKDYVGAILEVGSGVAAMFPGLGTLLSIGIDLINLGRDTGAFKAAGNKAKGFVKEKLSGDAMLYIPVVGPIYGIMKAMKMFKSGNKKGGLAMMGKAIAAIVPGGALITDILLKMLGLGKVDESSGSSESGEKKKKGGLFNRDKKKKENGSGDATAAPSQKGFGEVIRSTFGGERGASDGGSSTFADNLARAAEATGGHTTKSSGICARKVGDAFSRVVGEKEASKYRGNAWQWISKLKGIGQKYFNTAGIAGTNAEVKKVPRGSILVWDKQSLHPYGHIEIADGKGHLISDFKRPANLGLYRRNPAGIKPLVFTPKGLKMPALSGISTSSGSDETSTGSDVSGTGTSSAEEDWTFEQLMSKFSEFNNSLVEGVKGTATSTSDGLPTASVTSASEGVSAPSIQTMSAGTPQATTATATQVTAQKVTSAPPTNTQAPSPPVVQPVPASQSEPSSMDTEIRDTDLALLNSILFS